MKLHAVTAKSRSVYSANGELMGALFYVHSTIDFPPRLDLLNHQLENWCIEFR